MTNAKYTRDGLPVISKENLRALDDIIHRIYSRSSEEKEIIDRLKEDPDLFNYLNSFCMGIENSKGRIHAVAFFAGSIFVYEALRRQAAANKLEREVEGK